MKPLAKRFAARGFALLRVAVLEVLYEAKNAGECIGGAEIGKRAGIFRESGWATKAGNDWSVWGVLNSLAKEELITKCPQKQNKPKKLDGWEITEELFKMRSQKLKDVAWGGDNKLIKSYREKQWGFCLACLSSLPERPDVDHVVARAVGGDDTNKNKQLLCPRCNRSRGKKDFEEFVDSLEADALDWVNYFVN